MFYLAENIGKKKEFFFLPFQHVVFFLEGSPTHSQINNWLKKDIYVIVKVATLSFLYMGRNSNEVKKKGAKIKGE